MSKPDATSTTNLDGLPWEQRKKYCYCNSSQTHCGVCSCGKPGHIRALLFFTGVWCDECYARADKQMTEEQ